MRCLFIDLRYNRLYTRGVNKRIIFALLTTASVGCSASTAGGGGSGSLDFDTYYSKYFELGCRKSFECCTGSGDDDVTIGRNWQTGVTNVDGCTKAPGPQILNESREDLRKLVSAGSIVFHGDKAAACIAALQAYTCEKFFNNRVNPAACDDMWEGKLALGATCDASEQCPARAACIGSSSKGYRCERIPAKGEACTGYCPDGLYCNIDSATPTCVATKPAGSPCDPSRLECDGICDFTSKLCESISWTPACVGK